MMQKKIKMVEPRENDGFSSSDGEFDREAEIILLQQQIRREREDHRTGIKAKDELIEQLQKNIILLSETERRLNEKEQHLQDMKQQLQQKAQQLEKKLQSKDQQLQAVKQQLLATDQELQNKNSLLKDQHLYLKNKDKNLRTKHQELQFKDQQLQVKDQQLQAKDQQLQQSNQQLQIKGQRLQQMDLQFQAMNRRLQEKLVENEELSKQINELKSSLSYTDDDIGCNNQTQMASQMVYGNLERRATYYFKDKHVVSSHLADERHEYVKNYRFWNFDDGPIEHTISRFNDTNFQKAYELFGTIAKKRVEQIFQSGRFQDQNGVTNSITTVILSHQKEVAIDFQGRYANEMVMRIRRMSQFEIKQNNNGFYNHFQGPRR